MSKIADVGMPETPTPPSIGKRRQWGHPFPLEYADVLNGWSLDGNKKVSKIEVKNDNFQEGS